MARIPYADLQAPEKARTVARIVAERGAVLNLYGMLLNSTPIAEGWLTFLTAVRQQARLSARIRELLIMRVAVLNGAGYEFAQHLPFALKAGVTQAQVDALQSARFEAFEAFDAAEQAVLRYCDAMTREVRVPDAVFAPLKQHFDAQDIVEITATVGAYNMVSRFLEALQVDHE